MFRLFCVAILKATSLKIMKQIISSTEQSYHVLSSTLWIYQLRLSSRCLILAFSENPKASRVILKSSSQIALKSHRGNSSTAADSPVKLQSDRGIFNIDIAASILQENRCKMSPNRYRFAGRSGKMAPGPILWIRRGHPPPHRHLVEIHNMKTLKPPNPPRPAATAPLPLRMSGNVPWLIPLSVFRPVEEKYLMYVDPLLGLCLQLHLVCKFCLVAMNIYFFYSSMFSTLAKLCIDTSKTY